MKEVSFAYFGKDKLSFPLSDAIKIATAFDKNDLASIVSNSNEISSQIVADEIDFYINNTQDDVSQRISSVELLYNARLIAFDLAQYFDQTQEVGNLVLVISQEACAFLPALQKSGFKAIVLPSDEIKSIDGHLGAFEVGILRGGEWINVKTDQIIWQKAPDGVLSRNGIYDFDGVDAAEIVAALSAKCGVYNYKNYISYNENICQYHKRRVEICAKCADTCPTLAITKDDESKNLIFSHIDCQGCGGCVSVCPSGALDYTQMPRAAFVEIARLYRDKIALIIPKKMWESLKYAQIQLPKNVLPFAIEGEKYLHEAHLITLLQESGAQVVFYTDFISVGSFDAIGMLNQVYNAKFGKDAVLTAKDKNSLQNALREACCIKNSKYSIDESSLKKREIFSARLSHIVQNDDLGVIKSGENIHYGVVKIDESKCTLCLSCVGACNVGALSAYEEDFSLRINNSLCTTCKYCEVTCPEKCIEVVRGDIPLCGEWFAEHTAAKDEMFECVVCKKPYASKRSVEKIAALMKPYFSLNDEKLKTLYCCAECKPKVMFEVQISKERSELAK